MLNHWNFTSKDRRINKNCGLLVSTIKDLVARRETLYRKGPSEPANDLVGVIYQKMEAENLHLDHKELVGFIVFTLGAIFHGISSLIYNMMIHMVNGPEN
jgi:cytochrome P450